jgi:hypothetical protein
MQAEQREAEQEYQRTIHQQTSVFHLPTPTNPPIGCQLCRSTLGITRAYRRHIGGTLKFGVRRDGVDRNI